ncbi:hypothetical protein [Pyruvatibacter mobilis]|uniref:hypothetical protein n=1 Tax=Pyruvatibacter mobilis TaxID=1712261 RepID=UPI003BB04081
MTAKAKDFAEIYRRFGASIAQRHDCGWYCAPLNGGEPVCCTTGHAIPIVQKSEWKLLKGRTDLWRSFKPFDKTSREIVDELHESCKAIECKGAAYCERDNRTLACRAFPFFPYFNKQRELVGLGYYWSFEDRCWVLSNLACVDPEFVGEFLSAYELLFEKDEDELEAFIDESASMRRVFSRRGDPLPLIGRDGKLYKILPKTKGRIIPAVPSDFKPHGAYKSPKAYRKAVKEEGGDPEASFPPVVR